MHKIAMTGLMAAGMMMATGGTAALAHDDVAGACMARTLYSDAACGCIADKAGTQLSSGQVALLLAHGDGEINAYSTARTHGLSLGEVIEVHGFMQFTAPGCELTH